MLAKARKFRGWCCTGLDRENPGYLELALAAADLHVEAGDAAAAQTIMQAVQSNLDQVLRMWREFSLRWMLPSRGVIASIG